MPLRNSATSTRFFVQRVAAFATVAILAVFVNSTQAATYTLNTIARFNGTNGSSPTGSLTIGVTGSGLTVTGTTQSGGSTGSGTVFSVPTAGGTPSTLASFSGTNGGNPFGGLTRVGTTLYGTTQNGGTNGFGTAFSIPDTGGTLTTIVTFTSNSSSGRNPVSRLTRVGNFLFGTTELGGANGQGAIFSVPLAGGAATIVHSFNGINGARPLAGLTPSFDGNTLYGTTRDGGSNGLGTVFAVPITGFGGGGPLTTLASFSGANGANPYAGLALSGSNLFGTTYSGGANNSGTVFYVPQNGGPPTTVATFNGVNGARPWAGLTIVGNDLVGTTSEGGTNNLGTVFSLPIIGGPLTTIATFNGLGNGAKPVAELVVSGTSLYGTTAGGGSVNDHGTVFALVVPEPTTLALLSGMGLFALRRWR